MSFLSEFSQGMQIAKDNYEREQSRKLAEKRAAAQDSLASKNFDLQTFLANLATGKDVAASQTGKVHEGNDQGVVSAPNVGTSSAKGGTFEVSGGVPVITPPPGVKVPGAPSIGIPDTTLPVQSFEEVQRNKDTASNAEDVRALDLFGKQKKLVDDLSMVDLDPETAKILHLPPGLTDPKLLETKAKMAEIDVQTKARLQAASDAAAARGQVFQETLKTHAANIEDRGKKTYEAEAKPYEEIANLASSAHDLAGLNTGSSDIQLIELAQRIVNHGAIVRDSTINRFMTANNMIERAKGQIQSMFHGNKLTDETRQQILAGLDKVAEHSAETIAEKAKRYRDTAAARGLNPDNIAPDLGSPTNPNASPQAAISGLKIPSGENAGVEWGFRPTGSK